MDWCLRLRCPTGRLVPFVFSLWIMQGAQGNWPPNLGASLGCLKLATRVPQVPFSTVPGLPWVKLSAVMTL